MSKRKARHEPSKSVTVRLSNSDSIALAEEVEKTGSNNSAVLKVAWASYREKSDLALLMRKLESRMVSKVFEVCSATLGLSEEERKTAKMEFNQRVRSGGKS